jgi:DNA-3-methyladenine glycosylase II
MRIRLPEGFNGEWMLNHIRTSSFGTLYRFTEPRVLHRALRLARNPAVAEFDLSEEGVMQLRVVPDRDHVAAPRVKDAGLLAELQTQARFLWGLDDDAAGAYHTAMASDPDLAPLVQRFGALRILRAADLYEALLVAILGQQVSVRAAQAIRRRLMENRGTRMRVEDGREGGDCFLYPAPQQVLEGGEAALREQGISGQKAGYLLGIARRAAAGELEREAFAALSDEEAIARLCTIRGVGRWTAEVVAMRGLGRRGDRQSIFLS